MNKKANHLYNEIGKIEEKLLSIRSKLVRDEITPEFAAIDIRKASMELTNIAVSVFDSKKI